MELPTEGTEVAQGGESYIPPTPTPPCLSTGEKKGYEIGKAGLMVDSIGAVESVKAASDIYAPVSGVIEAINETLADQPSLLNKKPQSDGTSVFLPLPSISSMLHGDTDE